jgi:hypothetical protein
VGAGPVIRSKTAMWEFPTKERKKIIILLTIFDGIALLCTIMKMFGAMVAWQQNVCRPLLLSFV